MSQSRHPIFQAGVDHFAGKKTKIIEVPEWGDGDTPAIIHASPMTMGQQTKLFKGAKDGDLDVLIDCLVMKAIDENGSPVFSRADKSVMRRKLDPNVIIRVANEILEVEDAEDLEKN